MSEAHEPDRDIRSGDDQALEEIRRLFARYRRIARHGVVTERPEMPDESAEDDRGPATAGR